MLKDICKETNPEQDLKNTKRYRKKSHYRKINNETRQKLIELVKKFLINYFQVYLKDFLLKDAAKLLNINYSTAKTIVRIFRYEKRISKKNSPDLEVLKSLKTQATKRFNIIKNKRKGKKSLLIPDGAYDSNSSSTNESNSIMMKEIQNSYNFLQEKSKDLNLNKINFFNHCEFFKNAKNVENLINSFNINPKLLTENLDKINNLSMCSNLINTIQNLSSMVNICFENLKFNQAMINVVMCNLNENNKQDD